MEHERKLVFEGDLEDIEVEVAEACDVAERLEDIREADERASLRSGVVPDEAAEEIRGRKPDLHDRERELVLEELCCAAAGDDDIEAHVHAREGSSQSLREVALVDCDSKLRKVWRDLGYDIGQFGIRSDEQNVIAGSCSHSVPYLNDLSSKYVSYCNDCGMMLPLSRSRKRRIVHGST